MLKITFYTQLLAFMILVLCFSCKQASKYKIIESKVSQDQTIITDTSFVEIKIDSNKRLFEYKVSSSTADGTFCGYNPNSNSLDFFDLFKGRELEQIALKFDKHNKYGAITGCSLVNKDSVFLLTSERILLVDGSGTVRKDIKINESSNDHFFKQNYMIESERTKNFSYVPRLKKILSTNVSAFGSEHKNAYNLSPVIQISIENTPEFKSMPMSWSELYKDNYYGFFIKSFISFKNDKFILSFPIEPNIYVYNRFNEKKTTYGGYPHFKNLKSLLAEPLDGKDQYNDDKKIKNYLESISYGKVIPDLKEELYFRIMSLGLSGKDRENHSFQNRKLFLIIYDNNFRVVKTLGLNDRRYVVDGAFATEKGLLFPCPNSASTLRFKIFNFKID